MLAVLDLVTQVAPSRSTVLISGESGTGKEVIAKAIHAASTRADKAFIPINTGSIPVDLLESQLFGHVKGAFTSAIASKKGLFEVADQGTIFFDEISTVSPETQAKLLRVIQEREFMRLGGTETIKVDVRILAASNEDLRKLVREGRFREDLFHRLNVISIQLPPLRERKEDIPLLAERFLEIFCRENNQPLRHFTRGAMKMLMDYDWPGNVRELENAVERAVVLSTSELMDVDLLPESVNSREIVKGVRVQLDEFLPVRQGESDPPAAPIFIRDSRGSGTANHCGHARAHELESDRSGRAFSDSALDAQSENQAARHRNAAPSGRSTRRFRATPKMPPNSPPASSVPLRRNQRPLLLHGACLIIRSNNSGDERSASQDFRGYDTERTAARRALRAESEMSARLRTGRKARRAARRR